MKSIQLSVLLGVSLLLTACGGDSSNSDTVEGSNAQYRVTFTADWNAIDFPTQFPVGAHFSGLIGATHNNSINFWNTGVAASIGIRQVAETGSKSRFIDEITAEQNNGTAEFLLNGGGIDPSPGKIDLEFSINQAFSLVTLVSMVAPSPDWFVGVHDLDLYDTTTGDWRQTVTVELNTYDAGTDDGVTFSSANAATTPPGNIVLLTSNPADTDFDDGVQRATMETIGRFVFERIQ